MKKKISRWYVRQEGQITGPFYSKVIINKLRLGRLSFKDEVSIDQASWSTLSNQPQLHPDNQRDPQLEKVYLDERDGYDRRNSQNSEDTEKFKARRKQDRRENEDATDISRRQLRTKLLQRYRIHQDRFFWPLTSVFLLIFTCTLLAILYPTKLPVPLPNCESEPAPNINWNNCVKLELDLTSKDLSSAQLQNSQIIASNLMNINLHEANLAFADLRFSDLSYSQLSASNMLGANFEKVNLSYADLTNANMSFANLKDAKLGGAILEGTRFDNAIWIDGKTCLPKSVGRCLVND